jgi:radical SAM superfamily enzyme YgiQ (UPF0313 family)
MLSREIIEAARLSRAGCLPPFGSGDARRRMRNRPLSMVFIIVFRHVRSNPPGKGGSMKVLLIQSPTGRREAPIYPLGPAFLSAHLKARGHEVSGVDLSLHIDPVPALLRALKETRPDAAAVSLRNIDDSSWPVTWSYMESFDRVMDVLRDFQGTLVVGGTGFSIYADAILERWPGVRFGISGEGEEALPDLLDRIETGNAPAERLITPSMPDVGTLLNPDYTLFPLSDYPGRGSIGLQSRRGCPFGCRYCTYGRIGGRSFRTRPVEKVVEDARRLEQLGARSFMFVDSVFDHPRGYAEQLVRALGASGTELEWGAWLSESVSSDFLCLLRANGCSWVDFSPDAVTARGMRLLGKPSGGRRLFSVVRDARRAGLTVGVNFFNGNPGEGFPALLLKLAFMFAARALLGFRRTFVNIGTIRIYPGSPMAMDLPPGTDLMEPVFMAPRGLSAAVHRLFAAVRRRRRR